MAPPPPPPPSSSDLAAFSGAQQSQVSATTNCTSPVLSTAQASPPGADDGRDTNHDAGAEMHHRVIRDRLASVFIAKLHPYLRGNRIASKVRA